MIFFLIHNVSLPLLIFDEIGYNNLLVVGREEGNMIVIEPMIVIESRIDIPSRFQNPLVTFEVPDRHEDSCPI